MRDPTPIEIQEIVREIYKVPTVDEVKTEMRKVQNGMRRMPKMNQRYFFKERTMSTVKTGVPFGSILEGDGQFMKVFELANRYCRSEYEGRPEEDYVKNCALMMKSYARLYRKYHMPSMFDFGRAIDVCKKYNLNNIVYDFACGWGQRMVAALANGMDYYGTDTNPNLCKCLEDCAFDYCATNNVPNHATIFNQQSEIEIEGLRNSVGLCFSSPPYFDYETYRGENTSTVLHPEYHDWLEGYMRPTLENCRGYLVDGGHLAVNVKNIEKNPIHDDVNQICLDMGLELVEAMPYKVNMRLGAKNQKNKDVGYADEKIMVYKKV